MLFIGVKKWPLICMCLRGERERGRERGKRSSKERDGGHLQDVSCSKHQPDSLH